MWALTLAVVSPKIRGKRTEGQCAACRRSPQCPLGQMPLAEPGGAPPFLS